MKANEYFLNNVEQLKKGLTHPARAKYQDGTQANKTSIYNVFEQYDKGEVPIHTFRATAIKSAIHEVLWIWQKQSNKINDLNNIVRHWWNKFDVGNGTIGKRYGASSHQINEVLHNMVNDPYSQRHVLDLWQISDFKETKGLLPCVFNAMFTIQKNGLVNMHVTSRSSDYITAGAINRGQYYALGKIICGHLTYHTGKLYELNKFSFYTNDLHIYDRHTFALDELTSGVNESYSIEMKEPKDFFEYTENDFIINIPRGLNKLSKQLELAV